MKDQSESVKLEILALCNYAEFTQNGKFNIIGVYDQLQVDKIQKIWVNGFIVFTLRTDVKQTKKTVRLRIINDAGKSLLDASLVMNIGANGKANYIFQFGNLKVEEFGKYSIQLIHPEEDALIGYTDIFIHPGDMHGKKSGKEPRAN